MGNYDPRRRGRMAWQGNLAAMKAEGTLVTRMCASPCRYFERVDVDAMIALLGASGDLWDQRPPCPVCHRLNHFMASPGPGTVFRPLLSWNRGPDPLRPPQGWPPWPPAPHSPRAMPTFTLVITGRDGHQHVTLVDFPDTTTVKQAALDVLTDEHMSIAVARGAGDDIEFLGVWDRFKDGTIKWSPED